MNAKIDRGRAWRLFGAPTEQRGSVNDPRTHEDFGTRWNEKWIYLGEDGHTVEQVVLWLRYDFMGAFDGDGKPIEVPTEFPAA